jgi:hypothetical protein
LAPSGNTVASPLGTIIEAYVQIDNTTDWSCSSSREWYGPANYSANNPLSCTSYNVSTYSYFFAIPTLALSYTSTNNTQPWSGVFNGSGAFWWNRTAVASGFSSSDHYLLEVSGFAIFDASNSWPAGSASWSFNMAKLGRATQLTSVTVS